ncbi:copper resistance protein CopC [Microbacterium lacus]|uniref:copper resistance CopC family protein n=1 Tax=Microbacterium lacus TaxID=415217 RepID=UPI00384B8E61
MTLKISRAVGAALAVLLLSAGGIAIAAPASAHDELVSSDPANGATLDVAPEALTLTFSANINAEPTATEVQVTDASGTALAGTPSVLDNVLTVPIDAAGDEASGAITVLWKVVSSDGHPIAGEFGFTVTAPAPAPTATPSETASAEPSETADPSATPEPSETEVTPPADEDSTFAEVWPWIVGLVLFAAVGGAVLYLLVSRVRRDKALAENRARALGTPDSDSPAER